MDYRSLLIACLAPMRQRRRWVVSVLAGLVALIGINKAEADPNRAYCHGFSWIHCFDCSSNSDHPICARADADYPHHDTCNEMAADHPICAGTDADPAGSEAKYLYCTYASDADCNLVILDCWNSSTPCSEAVPTTATNQKTGCWYSDECVDFNSTEPYEYYTTYHFNNDTWQTRLCSSTPCSEVKQDQMTAVLTPTAGRPAQHRLGDAYPNPFNPAIVIPLNLATDEEQVHLALYNVLGHRVRQLWHGPLGAGSHRFVWDGRDEKGKAVAAGVYIYKVEVDGQVEAKKTTKLP